MASLLKSMMVWILVVLEISLFLTSTMAMDYGDFGRGSTKRFCGRMLTDSLAMICNNQYETIIHPDPQQNKRSGKRETVCTMLHRFASCRSRV